MIAEMPENKPQISYEDFAKLDIRIGTVVAAELVPDTDKLIKCTVDFGLKPSAQNADGSAGHSPEANGLGTRDIRTIVSGIAQWKKPEELIGRQFPYIVNLEPRVIRGIESEGMILAIRNKDAISLLRSEVEVEAGAKIS
ncbi:MAG: hypothetical protein Q8Q13_01145 [bacterium]|nr:hypothetical protein [bacterium]